MSILPLFLASAAQAIDISPGVRAGAYFDAESAFVGGEVELGIGEDWSFVPNVEFIFVDQGNLTSFNFDFQYAIRTDYTVEFWAGGGPAILHFDPADDDFDSDTDFGANIFFGVGFPLADSRFLPYVQPKLILADDVEFSLGFGVRF